MAMPRFHLHKEPPVSVAKPKARKFVALRKAKPTAENILMALTLAHGRVGTPLVLYKGSLNRAAEHCTLHITEAPNCVMVNVLYKPKAKRD